MKIMKENKVINYIVSVLENMPKSWLELTTHRLDIYEEKLAKTQFLEQFDALYKSTNFPPSAGHENFLAKLGDLPTAYDYIRLGHPLSCILEWGIGKLTAIKAENIISFSSKTIPVLAVLRKNLLDHKNTLIVHKGELPDYFDPDILKHVYGYNFDLQQVEKIEEISTLDILDKDNSSTIFISQENDISTLDFAKIPKDIGIDFFISIYADLGSILLINGLQNESYISEIQHVRRRETIAMTPANCLIALQHLVGKTSAIQKKDKVEINKASVIDSIHKITATNEKILVGSSGLSVQYAIMMGLIDNALEKHPGKAIKFIVPPNCYGGTNDQARRVAACLDNVEVLDLPVDGDHDMVQSIDLVLKEVAEKDAVPYIIAEIPTNPRVEVPDLEKLKTVLSVRRKTASGEIATDPVFILDQTFCPNVQFLSKEGILSNVRTISYVSGSKFPSGGQCTAGYCAANERAEGLMKKIENHIKLCDNEATDLQLEILAKQMPSMNQRINDAYRNTREFVNFIKEVLPSAKINFVSEELAAQGFTPSVFSLDLPTKGNTNEEKEAYKRALNHKLINLMITEIPNESKYCVSYGQLKGCYWTIPATSTQGTTKEDDKDYIARISVSPDFDLNRHKNVFLDFVSQI